jgi:hypothetical protein
LFLERSGSFGRRRRRWRRPIFMLVQRH